MNSDWREALASAVTKPLLVWLEEQPNKGIVLLQRVVWRKKKHPHSFATVTASVFPKTP